MKISNLREVIREYKEDGGSREVHKDATLELREITNIYARLGVLLKSLRLAAAASNDDTEERFAHKLEEAMKGKENER